MSTTDDVTPLLNPNTESGSRSSEGFKWLYKMPIKSDLTWNTIIILVTIVVMILSKDEITKVPLRVWLVGYVIHCALHMVCTYIAYRSLRETSFGMVADPNNVCNNIAGIVELANNIFSFIWWIVGLCWVISGGHVLANDAPKLFWLTTIFLVFKPIIIVISIIMACIVCIGGAAAMSLASLAVADSGPHQGETNQV